MKIIIAYLFLAANGFGAVCVNWVTGLPTACSGGAASNTPFNDPANPFSYTAGVAHVITHNLGVAIQYVVCQDNGTKAVVPVNPVATTVNTTTITTGINETLNCAVSTGGIGGTGATGATGANGAISRVQNGGVNVAVEPNLNFVNGGCIDNAGASSTDCTVGGATVSVPYLVNGGNSYIGMPLRQATLPIQGNFNWVNQGTASESTDGSALYITAANTAGTNLRMRCQGISTNTTLTTYVAVTGASGNFGAGGIGFYESGTGKVVALLENFAGGGGNNVFTVSNYTSTTAFSSTPFTINNSFTPAIWLQLVKTGGNLFYKYSLDGLNFASVLTSAYATFFTTAPDNWCYIADSEGSNLAPVVTELLSWKMQ